MAFTLRLEEIPKTVKEIKVVPYYGYAICICLHYDETYELWNYKNIPKSQVAKATAEYLKDNPKIDCLKIQDESFAVPKEKDSIKEKLFDFLTCLEKEEL